MAPEFFATTLTPGIALLILSTTMRIGNVRAALTELVRFTPTDLEALDSYQLFKNRASYLCRGLRLLNLSLLGVIAAAMIQLFIFQQLASLQPLTFGINVVALLLLFAGVVYLYMESRLTGRSIIALTNDMQAISNKS
jgi:hypothetical protein